MPSARFIRQLVAQDGDEPVLTLLTLDHAELEEPLFFVNNDEPVTSRGDVFQPFPFRVTRPEEGAPGDKVMLLQIDNVDRRIAATLRLLQTAADFTVELILPSAPDAVEMRFGPGLIMRAADWDAATVNGYLSFDDDGSEPVSGYGYTPGNAPALFAN